MTISTDRLCDCITWLVKQFEALRNPSICPVLWYLLASDWNSVTQISPSSERLWPCEICSYSNEKFYLLFRKIRWSMSSYAWHCKIEKLQQRKMNKNVWIWLKIQIFCNFQFVLEMIPDNCILVLLKFYCFNVKNAFYIFYQWKENPSYHNTAFKKHIWFWEGMREMLCLLERVESRDFYVGFVQSSNVFSCIVSYLLSHILTVCPLLISSS